MHLVPDSVKGQPDAMLDISAASYLRIWLSRF